MRPISPLRLLLGLCFVLLFFQISVAQDSREALTREQINEHVIAKIKETGKVFKWDDADDHLVWSAVVRGEGIISIGYQPTDMTDFKAELATINVNSPRWTSPKDIIINKINTRLKERGISKSAEKLFPRGTTEKLPYLYVRVDDFELLKELRSMPEVRYLEPAGYSLDASNYRGDTVGLGGSGCDTPPTSPSTLNPADYTVITSAPVTGLAVNSIQSWHHAEHNIPNAWAISNAGAGRGIALIDSGIANGFSSYHQEKMTMPEFAEGASTGRTITHYGFYDPNGGTVYDGPYDDCGHGTSMASLAAAPLGYEGTAAGIAYRANMNTYRGTDDVVIDCASEQAGVAASLTHAANDPNMHIISMSLGDVFYDNTVATAVQYANSQGKLIFAAAGTSTSLTNWYPVIFPATMPETVAVTGVTDGAVRDQCNTCHDGAEVDFVVCMQRDGNSNRNGVCLDRPNNFNHYVSGSSCATASMAGMAALVWGENPGWSSGQVLNRLIESADYYPARDGEYGWGKVDVLAAISPPGTCNSAVSNNLSIEITNISFPTYSEGFGSDNEWVISLGSETYYFSASENGASGNPASFDNGDCGGIIPINLNLGNTVCGQTSLNLQVETHEDDSAFGTCSCSSNDDGYSFTNVAVDMNSSTFTVSFTEGGTTYPFVFTYVATCTPLSTPPAATVTGGVDVCQNDADVPVLFYGSGGTPPYTITYTVNGGTTQSIMTTTNSATINHPTGTVGTYTYDLIDVTDANGCSQLLTSSTTVTVHPDLMATIMNDSPQCVGDNITIMVMPTGQTDYTFFIDANNDMIPDPSEVLQSSMSNALVSNTLQDNDVITIIVSNTNTNCADTVTTTVSTLPLSDPSCSACPPDYQFVASGGTFGGLTGTEPGIADYETDGIIESVQTITATAKVDYDSKISILMDPTFEVILGAEFHAFIDGCNGGAGGINLQGDTDDNAKKKKEEKEKAKEEAKAIIKTDESN